MQKEKDDLTAEIWSKAAGEKEREVADWGVITVRVRGQRLRHSSSLLCSANVLPKEMTVGVLPALETESIPQLSSSTLTRITLLSYFCGLGFTLISSPKCTCI